MKPAVSPFKLAHFVASLSLSMKPMFSFENMRDASQARVCRSARV
jgi:hypothetical protein